MVGVMDSGGITIGDRVQVGEERGTVLYVGPVPPTKGIWLGVDWDDPLRGKHDGIHDGLRYFQARYETSGSFVRLEKISPGQNIITAIHERYGGNGTHMDSKEMEEIQKAMNAPLFEMVGFEKISKKQCCFKSLAIVGLRDMRINSAGERGQLNAVCPNILELDLSRNLINSWLNIYEITSQLPSLQVLDLSENRLSYQGCDTSVLKNGFLSLSFIVLSKLEYSWDDIMYCARMWPQVERLQASFNKITTLSTPLPDVFYDLKVLNLEGNSILFWSEVEKLGNLPKLEVLNISNVGLTRIHLQTSNNLFRSLKYILLSGNFINSWDSISELDKLASLEELRFRNNPILDSVTRENARQIIIARIANLNRLNTQEINHEERRGAEIDYLKENGRVWLETAKNPAERAIFITHHPRYPGLVQKYGEMEEGELKRDAPTLKANLVRVTIESGERRTEKAVPFQMTVRALFFFVQRMFKIDSSQLSLTLVSSKNPLLKVPLDNLEKNLSYYSVEDGDTIRAES